jgi:hypothetical protein
VTETDGDANRSRTIEFSWGNIARSRRTRPDKKRRPDKNTLRAEINAFGRTKNNRTTTDKNDRTGHVELREGNEPDDAKRMEATGNRPVES